MEYDEIEGLLLSRELSKNNPFYAHRYISIGTELPLRVLVVIPVKGLILLSKLKVLPEESEKCKQRYFKAKAVDGIIKLLSVKSNKPMIYLYENIVWPLYKKYCNAYNAFKLLANGRTNILKDIFIKDELKKELMEIINSRFTPKKIRSCIKLNCYNFYGIDAIKESLLEGEKIGTDKIPIKFRIIRSPLYECITYAVNENEGIKLMNEALSIVKNTIEMKGGNFLLEEDPLIV